MENFVTAVEQLFVLTMVSFKLSASTRRTGGSTGAFVGVGGMLASDRGKSRCPARAPLALIYAIKIYYDYDGGIMHSSCDFARFLRIGAFSSLF